jgi:hypothetical protein
MAETARLANTVGLPGGRVASYEIIGTGATAALMLPGGPGCVAAYMKPNADLFSDVFRITAATPGTSIPAP